MDQCLFLTRLPAEIRVKIYEHVLAFKRPLKLRQFVAGSKDTGILRVSRTIYSEALPVFFDMNTITVTRNDFCLKTDSDLQTPLRRDGVRHLLVKNLSRSIRCSSYSEGNNIYPEGCCDVCRPGATSFIITVASLPRLQSITVDYHYHIREFCSIKDTIRGSRNSQADAKHDFTIECVGMTKYKLTSSLLPRHLSFIFKDVPINTIWTEVTDWGSKTASVSRDSTAKSATLSEEELLEHLRDNLDRDLADKIFAFWAVRRFLRQRVPSSKLTSSRAWRAIYDDSGDCVEQMEAWLRNFCDLHTVEAARATVQQYRDTIMEVNP